MRLLRLVPFVKLGAVLLLFGRGMGRRSMMALSVLVLGAVLLFGGGRMGRRRLMVLIMVVVGAVG